MARLWGLIAGFFFLFGASDVSGAQESAAPSSNLEELGAILADAGPDQRTAVRLELLRRTASPAVGAESQEQRRLTLHFYYRHFGSHADVAEVIEMLRRGLEVRAALGLGTEDLLLRLWQWTGMADGPEPAQRFLPMLRYLLEQCGAEASAMVPALWVKRAVFERDLGDYGAALASLTEGSRSIESLTGKIEASMEVWMLGYRPFMAAERFLIQLELGLLAEARHTLEAQGKAVQELPGRPAWAEIGLQINRARLAYFQGDDTGCSHAVGPDSTQDALARHAEEDPESLLRLTAMVELWRAVGKARSPSAEDRTRSALTLQRVLDEGHLQDKDAAQARRHLARIHIQAGAFARALELLPRDMFVATRSTTLDVVKYRSLRGEAARLAGWDGERLQPVLDDLEQSYGEFLEIWRSCPRPPSGVGFLQYPARRSIVSELVNLHLLVRPGEAGRLRAFQALLEAQACGSLSMELEAAAGDVGRIRTSLLGGDAGILALLPAPESSHLFVLDGEEFIHRRLPGEEAARRGLRDLLPFRPAQDGSGHVRMEDINRFATSSKRQGHRWFDAEVAKRILSWSQVFVVGADGFGLTAVEGLALGDGGQTLGTQALSHLPSIPWALARKQAPTLGGRNGVFVIAAPDLPDHEGLGPVHLDRNHVREWLSPFADSGEQVYLGAEARADRLASKALDEAAALLLYTHGWYASEEERPACLLLANAEKGTQRLFASDIESLFPLPKRSAPPLVILAACGTRRGPLRLGEDGVQHLGGAFLRSGSRSVLLSASDLDQEATRILCGHFLKHLAQPRTTISQAMAQARATLKGDPRFAHPYYYGQLAVSGLGHEALTR